MGFSRTRIRNVPGPPIMPFQNTITYIPTGQLLDTNIIVVDPDHSGYESHVCVDDTHKRVGGKYLEGGPLHIYHQIRKVKPISVVLQCNSSIRHRSEGILYPIFRGVPLGYETVSVQGLSVPELTALGTTGWARFRPGRPVVSLTSSLVELRELPRMLKARVSDFRGYRGTGKAYLEWKFGWESLLRDIKSMYDLYKDLDRRLQNIVKHNGKWSMRRGELLRDVSSEPYTLVGTSAYAFSATPYGDTIRNPSSSVAGIARRERTVWFEGRFRYYIPESVMNSKMWRLNTIRKMYGGTLTPDHAWELIPWSWLIDYFTNVGDVFSNLSGGYVDAVAKYAYVMATTRHTVSQRSSIVDINGMIHTGTIESDLTIKQRQAATPFGFGMDIGNLSDAQLMILTALGISKLRF